MTDDLRVRRFPRMSVHARALLVEVARQFVRDNNGRLLLSRAYMVKRGWKSSDMLAKAKCELLDGGFIFETVKGHRPNRASWYALTWQTLDRHPGYDLGAVETFKRSAYLHGDPLDREKLYADVAVGGMVSNMMLLQAFGKRTNGEVGITQAVKALRATMKEVHAGNLQSSETLLYSQAVALNAMFAEMACRSALNMGSHLQAAESYMRLALKAQSQCRNTLETLANIKNPPVVFAKQANISNGPQQVNNGAATNYETSTRTHAPAQAGGETENQPTKLLEGTQHGGAVLDARATGATTRGYQALEAVGAVHRSQERRRQGEG